MWITFKLMFLRAEYVCMFLAMADNVLSLILPLILIQRLRLDCHNKGLFSKLPAGYPLTVYPPED